MDYSHDDAGLVNQPIGYWSWAAGKAVVTYIRGALGELGLTQPQWWTLSQLATSPDGRDGTELAAFLQGYLDVGSATMEEEFDALIGRHLVVGGDNGLLRITDAGRELQVRTAERQQSVRDTIHAGIPDEEYVRTLKVLQRMIHNVGGEAWHE
jgi:DNA-binding MarR family transcriptional regulator